MIEVGKITLEILLNDPIYYMVWIYAIPVILGGIAAFFADRAADEKLKQTSTLSDKKNVYEFEDIKDPIAWGMMGVVVAVLPFASSIDATGDWQAVWAAAILAGLTSRAILMNLASKFVTKATKE